MTEPLTPADCDLRDFAYMPLDVTRLLDSDLFALATGDEFKAAIALWCKAWLQMPAASLPDDDRVLAHLSGAGAKWRKVKDMALKGFVKCSDGRFYHPVVAEKANEAWGKKQSYRERSKKGNAKRWGSQKDEQEQSLKDATAIPKGLLERPKEEGEGEGPIETSSIGGAAKRGSRLPIDFEMPNDWLQWAIDERHWPACDAQDEAAAFIDFWHAKAGKDASKLDWQATWRNWVRNSRRVAVVQRELGHSGVPL